MSAEEPDLVAYGPPDEFGQGYHPRTGQLIVPQPKKARKKPVIIEYMPIDTVVDAVVVADWIKGHGGEARYFAALGELRASNGELVRPYDPAHVRIETLEGRMRAEIGDRVIRGVNGEFYPCKPDIFAATYNTEESFGGAAVEGQTTFGGGNDD